MPKKSLKPYISRPIQGSFDHKINVKLGNDGYEGLPIQWRSVIDDRPRPKPVIEPRQPIKKVKKSSMPVPEPMIIRGKTSDYQKNANNNNHYWERVKYFEFY